LPSRPEPEPQSFADIWPYAETVPGWLTEEQGRLLHDEASRLRTGAVVLEIGSHRGRSTVVLAHALAARDGHLLAMDPFVEGRLFGGQATRAEFELYVRNSGVGDVVELVPEYSTKARPGWERPLDLVYVDGKHDYWTVSDDLRWAEHLPPDGPMLVHDAFSSIGVTLGLLHQALPGRRLTYERRVGSLALFRVHRPRAADRLRIVREVPWWLRNVGVKVLLRLMLRPVARLLGHDSPYDPY